MTATTTDARLAAVLRGLADAVLVVDGQGRLTWANGAAERLFGWPLEDWEGVSGLELIHPEDLDLALLSLASVQGKDVGTPLELRVRTTQGWRLVEMIGVVVAGGPDEIVLSVRDLTERRRWEVAGDHVARFRSLMHNAATVTMLVSAEGKVDAVSGAVTRLLGHDQELVQGRPLADLVHPADRPVLAAALARAISRAPRADVPPGTVEVRLRHLIDGRTTPFELTIVNLLDDPTVGGFVISGHDITRLRTVQDQLSELANRDSLTGLPNRAALDARLAAAIGRITADDARLSVAFLDLDRFKPINDLLGHAAGDELLCHVAARLRAAVRDDDFVARFGGDEFVVVTEASDEDDAHLADRLEQVVAQPFQLSTGPAQIFASVGVAAAHPGQTVKGLLSDADAEMYRVKRTRRASPQEAAMARGDRRVLAEQLAVAITQHQLVVHYQPVADLAGPTVVGFEALVRWNHPTRGLLHPAAFLGVAEDAGLESEIDNYVLRTACADLAALPSDPTRQLSMSVNLSIGQLAGDGFVDLVQSVLEEHGLAPKRLCFEITERRILERPDHGPATAVRVTLDALAEAGIRLAVDDFGTGFSSLTHVLELPIQILKIDRSFIDGITTDRQRHSIVAAIIELARGMGIDAIAKGIEHPDQLAALQQLRCPLGQGYLLGRPAPSPLRTSDVTRAPRTATPATRPSLTSGSHTTSRRMHHQPDHNTGDSRN